MADPPAALRPVAHDPAAFDAALAEVDAAIERLTAAMDDRRSRVQALLASWEGTAASRFAGTWDPRLLAVHHDVLGELRATRRNLCTALDAIEDENASRARRRAAWQQEQEQERAQARAAGP